MKIKSMIYSAILAGVLIAFLFSCKKEEAPKVIPTITVKSVTNITDASASSGGEVTSEGGVLVTSRGVCWSTNQNPTISDNKTSNGSGLGSFTSSITGLSPGATYYLRAYAINTIGTSYSSQISFNALALAPQLNTTGVSSITYTSVNCGGNVTDDGGAAITARGVCWSASPNPTIANSKTNDGTGTGSYTSAITGLTAGTTYYVRAYATNSADTAYGSEVSFKTVELTVTDIDGNVYHTVIIGDQVWMVENLKTTKYRNGDPITNVTDNVAWSTSTIGAYCWYNNDAASYKATYGALYNWHGVNDSRNIAPTGWHVPTDTEWTSLTTFLGGESVAGSKLKETGTSHWVRTNPDVTNTSGFTALPGGARHLNGTFGALWDYGYWWSSTEHLTEFGRYRLITSDYNNVNRNYNSKTYGFSVRCVKD